MKAMYKQSLIKSGSLNTTPRPSFVVEFHCYLIGQKPFTGNLELLHNVAIQLSREKETHHQRVSQCSNNNKNTVHKNETCIRWFIYGSIVYVSVEDFRIDCIALF